MMMRLRGQALAMSSSSSSSYSLLRRVASSPRSIVHCSSTRPLVSYRGFRVAPLPATAIARLELRGTSPVVLRSRLSSVSVRASSHLASDAGSIDSSMMQSMENKIKEQLNAETVIVKDAYGDGRHVSIYVVSTAFEGQPAVCREWCTKLYGRNFRALCMLLVRWLPTPQKKLTEISDLADV